MWSADDGTSTAAEGFVATDAELDALAQTHAPVSFSVLSDLPPARGRGWLAPKRWAIPDHIRRLDGQPIAIDGYMLPLDFEDGTVSRFILNASYDMCQFGAPSLATERLEVTMAAGQRTPFTHRAVRVYGTLTVHERIEDDEVVGLYALNATALGPPGLGY